MVVKNKDKFGVNRKYAKWCREIAKTNNVNELIAHFREHAYRHFDRHRHEGDLGLRIWMVGVFNFMHIFEKKFLNITSGDMLFKLCSFYKDHKKGPKPSFDIDKFMKEYKGDMKDYYYKYQTSKK